jgi:hypothetical protein
MEQLTKQLVQYRQKVNKGLSIIYSTVLLCCCFICFLTSCRNANEIIVYYKTGFVESPISKSFEDFEDDVCNHPADTVIFIKSETFDRYYSVIRELQFIDGDSENIHDYSINIKCDDKNIAIPFPVPDSLNEKIIVFSGQRNKGDIKAFDLYHLLCSTRYFDFFTKEDLAYHPLIKKYQVPSDYNWKESSNTAVPLKIKSRYKVILRPE